MKTRVPLLAAVLSVCFYSYSYCETINGTTNNAAANGPVWNMADILPPEAGITVGSVLYRYTVEKNVNDDFTVTIQNRKLGTANDYIFRETDDWSQVPGSTINKSFTLSNVPSELFGEGSIETTGFGTVNDPSVYYTYKFDPCYIIIANPECPGYNLALYDWLKERGLLDREPDVNDPYYDEWVQLNLNRETEVDEEEKDEEQAKREEEETTENDPIEMLNKNVDIEGFIDGARQNDIISQLSTIPQFEVYTNAIIPGGIYEETITLQDSDLPDNARALSNLGRDEVHREMVRSQYRN